MSVNASNILSCVDVNFLFKITEVESSKPTENPIDVSIASVKEDSNWQSFSVGISPSNKERVYVVTPQPVTTSSMSSQVEQKKQKTVKETENNSKESKKTFDAEKEKTKSVSDTFESIEKAYQVLPQAVNNLAVASTGPESVPLWGIMEHEEFASLSDNERDDEKNESPEIPVLYSGHSKASDRLMPGHQYISMYRLIYNRSKNFSMSYEFLDEKRREL